MKKYIDFLLKAIVTCAIIYGIAYFCGHHESLLALCREIVEEVKKHIGSIGK